MEENPKSYRKIYISQKKRPFFPFLRKKNHLKGNNPHFYGDFRGKKAPESSILGQTTRFITFHSKTPLF